LNHFDPFAADEATKRTTPGLAAAYDVADEALDLSLDLNHWKTALSSQGHETIVIDSDDDSETDEEMRLAIEMSIADIRAQEALNLAMPTASWAGHTDTQQIFSGRVSRGTGVSPDDDVIEEDL
jgi:hypothetical protein